MAYHFGAEFMKAWARQLVGRDVLTAGQVDCIRSAVCANPFSDPPLPDRSAVFWRARARSVWVSLAGQYETEIGVAMLAHGRGVHLPKVPSCAAKYGGLRPYQWVLIWLDEFGCLTVADVLAVAAGRFGGAVTDAVARQFDRGVKYCLNRDLIEAQPGARVGKRYGLTAAGRAGLSGFQQVKGGA